MKWPLCVYSSIMNINEGNEMRCRKKYFCAIVRSEIFICLCGKYNFQMPASLRDMCDRSAQSPYHMRYRGCETCPQKEWKINILYKEPIPKILRGQGFLIPIPVASSVYNLFFSRNLQLMHLPKKMASMHKNMMDCWENAR